MCKNRPQKDFFLINIKSPAANIFARPFSYITNITNEFSIYRKTQYFLIISNKNIFVI